MSAQPTRRMPAYMPVYKCNKCLQHDRCQKQGFCAQDRYDELTVADTLSQRGKTHGDFGDNATFALQMRDLLRSMKPRYHDLPAEQRLALDEIALKIARIVSGGHNEPEHWHDIQGYAKLAEQCAASWQEIHKEKA